MMQEKKEYQRKWNNYVERMPLERSQGETYFIALLEDGTQDVREEDGHNSSFSLGTSHDSVLETEEGEEDYWSDG